MAEQLGHKVIGTIVGVKGECSWGHNVGERLELSGYSPGGLCGFFYHDIFPYIIILQLGGGFPPAWGDPNIINMECLDKYNAVTIELRRET